MTIFDCEIIVALHRHAFDSLSKIVEELLASVPLTWTTIPRFRQLLGDVRTRLKAASDYYCDRRIQSALEHFDRLAKGGARSMSID